MAADGSHYTKSMRGRLRLNGLRASAYCQPAVSPRLSFHLCTLSLVFICYVPDPTSWIVFLRALCTLASILMFMASERFAFSSINCSFKERRAPAERKTQRQLTATGQRRLPRDKSDHIRHFAVVVFPPPARHPFAFWIQSVEFLPNNLMNQEEK